MKVGVLGAGQLGRMLALAGYPLGIDFVFLDPAPDPCAARLGRHIRAPYADDRALDELAGSVDVATMEFENIPADTIRDLSAVVPVFPSANALAVAQDRLLEKQLFRRLGIGTAEFASADGLAALEAFAEQGACIVKSRRFGYDGSRQWRIHRAADVADAWASIGETPLIVERLVKFEREISIIAVRGRGGDVSFYPIAENRHRDGILALSFSRPGDSMQRKAEDYARRILEELDYIGAMGVEYFQCGDELLANEFAPRVHNSGHWTIEGSVTSQFQNHLRAILGLPLGSCAPRGLSVMVNCIGRLPDRNRILEIPSAYLHVYNKEPRPGRKVGHVTYIADNPEAIERQASLIDSLCR